MVSTVTLSASARSHQWPLRNLAQILPIKAVVLTNSKSKWMGPFDLFNFSRQFQLKNHFFSQFFLSGASEEE
jgi:hypothetical protein